MANRDVRSLSTVYSQGEQRLLQSSAADDDIPKGVAQRLHLLMERQTGGGQDRQRQPDFAEALGSSRVEDKGAGSENLYEVEAEGGARAAAATVETRPARAHRRNSCKTSKSAAIRWGFSSF